MNYTYYRRYQPSGKKRNGFRSFFWLVLFLVVVFLALFYLVRFIQSVQDEKRNEASLTIQTGDIQVKEWGADEFSPAADTQMILLGDEVKSGESSSALLKFDNGYELTMEAKTTIRLADFVEDETPQTFSVEVLNGSVRVNNEEVDNENFQLELRTDVMNIRSIGSSYRVGNRADAEFVAVSEGQVKVDFVDRSNSEQIIESSILGPDQMSFLDDAKERALLNRENVTLVEENTLDDFVQPLIDETSVDETPVVNEPIADEPEAEPVETTTAEVPIMDPLQISLISPSSGVTIQDTAIAIEGRITSGTAGKVIVTWSGNGVPYTLGYFDPVSGAFRYVADTVYANFAAGQNTYQITAYDADGNASNTVTVVITGEF